MLMRPLLLRLVEPRALEPSSSLDQFARSAANALASPAASMREWFVISLGMG